MDLINLIRLKGLLPFFMAATAWGVWPYTAAKPRSPGRFLFGLLMAVTMMQTYILGIALIAPLALLLFVSREKLPKRPFWLAVVLFFVSFGLFGALFAGSFGTGDGKFTGFVTQLNLQFDPISMTHAVRFITGLDFWGADVAANTPIPAPRLALLTHWLLSLALTVGLVRALVDLRDREKRPLAITLLVWFGVPIIGLSFLPFLIHAHYLLLTLPAGHLLAAYGVEPLLIDKTIF